MRVLIGVFGLAATAVGLLLIAPAPSLAGDYGYDRGGYDRGGYGRDDRADGYDRDYGRGDQRYYDGSWTENRRDDGNVSYNAYNSYDGYARGRGYWDRPNDYRYSCRSRYNGCYRGYRYDGYGAGYGYGVDYRGAQTYYYPGYGYGSADTPSPAFPVGGYGAGARDPQRSQWCAWRYRSYDWRTGYYVGYDGYRHYCG